MGMMAVPILPDQVEAWKGWLAALEGEKQEAWEDFNQRYGLTVHRVWLQANPDGSHLALVNTEGPGDGGFIPKLSQSSHDFDKWFRENIQKIHGMDLSQGPPGPPPELILDFNRA